MKNVSVEEKVFKWASGVCFSWGFINGNPCPSMVLVDEHTRKYTCFYEGHTSSFWYMDKKDAEVSCMFPSCPLTGVHCRRGGIEGGGVTRAQGYNRLSQSTARTFVTGSYLEALLEGKYSLFIFFWSLFWAGKERNDVLHLFIIFKC